jgi:23S rRNA (uridine2552-2'-O)-methyltransferase
MGSRLGDRDRRHDRFYQRAKSDRFAARAVYKLEEIDQRFGLIDSGARVLDLGCRPGSWLQYVARKSPPPREGAEPKLVGIDRQPLDVSIPGSRILIGDVFDTTPTTFLGGLSRFDVVLSDMAPDTTGVRSLDQARSEGLFERALDIAESVLAPGGNFLGKLFQGPDWNRILTRARTRFSTVKTVKPEGSRKESIEQYVVALGYRPPAPTPSTPSPTDKAPTST